MQPQTTPSIPFSVPATVISAPSTREHELEAELARVIAKYNELLETAMELADKHIDACRRATEAAAQREAWRDYAFTLEAERDDLKILADEAEGWRVDWHALSAELRAVQRRLLLAGCPPDSQPRPLAPTRAPQRRRFVEAERPTTRPFHIIEGDQS